MLFLGKSLAKHSAAIIGCGANGSRVAYSLVRSGIGELLLVDRDIVGIENLGTQNYYSGDIGTPKAVALAAGLRNIGSRTKLKFIVDDANPSNIGGMIKGKDIVIDGTDNLSTRFLINDACKKNKIPWVFGSCVRSSGMSATFMPRGPCFRCVFPRPSYVETCDTVGLLPEASALATALQSSEAKRLLVGKRPNGYLFSFDVWKGEFDRIKLKKRKGCPACAGKYEFLEKPAGASVLCGSNAVHIAAPEGFDFGGAVQRIGRVTDVASNEFFASFHAGALHVALFRNGRAIVKGTNSISEAKSAYSKYVGG